MIYKELWSQHNISSTSVWQHRYFDVDSWILNTTPVGCIMSSCLTPCTCCFSGLDATHKKVSFCLTRYISISNAVTSRNWERQHGTTTQLWMGDWSHLSKKEMRPLIGMRRLFSMKLCFIVHLVFGSLV